MRKEDEVKKPENWRSIEHKGVPEARVEVQDCMLWFDELIHDRFTSLVHS